MGILLSVQPLKPLVFLFSPLINLIQNNFFNNQTGNPGDLSGMRYVRVYAEKSWLPEVLYSKNLSLSALYKGSNLSSG
jgi:hypothetical protein